MAVLVTAIHVLVFQTSKAWMAGTSPAMTRNGCYARHQRPLPIVQKFKPDSRALVAGIHVFVFQTSKAWMAGSSPRLSGLVFVDRVHGMDSSVF